MVKLFLYSKFWTVIFLQFLCNFEAEIFVQNFVLYSSKFSCLGRIRKSYFLRIRRCLLLAKLTWLASLPCPAMTCGRWSRPSWRMLGHSCWRAGQPPPTHSGRPPGKRVQLIIFPDPERILRNPASGCRTFSKHVSPTGVFQRRKDVDLKIIPILQYIVGSWVHFCGFCFKTRSKSIKCF